MSEAQSLELIARVEAQRTLLCSPGVGIFSGALGASTIVSSGQSAGWLTTLGKRVGLSVPSGVRGIVRSKPPDRLRAAVQYGQVLYEIGADVATAPSSISTGSEIEPGSVPSVRSPLSGRFYHRSAPGEASLCEVGREIEIGSPIGLIEVMKTFMQVLYRAERGLPERARILRVIASDGSDVDEGAVLIVVEAR